MTFRQNVVTFFGYIIAMILFMVIALLLTCIDFVLLIATFPISLIRNNNVMMYFSKKYVTIMLNLKWRKKLSRDFERLTGL